MIELGIDRKVSEAMKGLTFTGERGFIQAHSEILNKAKERREAGDREGESLAYSMATALRMYFDSVYYC
tara:strand:- start:251 stop:457 length:207 start_codon:yes stop_codon:yes gene_type:complete